MGSKEKTNKNEDNDERMMITAALPQQPRFSFPMIHISISSSSKRQQENFVADVH